MLGSIFKIEPEMIKSAGVNILIRYDKLWLTMKEKGISQYELYTKYNMNRAQLNRLRHNKNVTVATLDKLCNILHYRIEDIAEHFPDDNNIF